MSDDDIKQSVEVSGNAVVQRLIQIGKIVIRPARWQDELWDFLRNHPLFVGAALLLNVALLAFYLPVKDLYLIDWWWAALTAVSLTLAAWGWYRWGRRRDGRYLWLAGSGAAVTAAVIGWWGWQIANPPPFPPPPTLGIALAELGEGGGYRRTETAALLSDQIFNRLNDEVQALNADLSRPQVALRRVGVIADPDTAVTYGRRLGAEVVIWGQVIDDEEGVTVRFQLLETFDTAVNPNFPLILPVTLRASDVAVGEVDRAGPAGLKESVAQQSAVLSAFTLGLLAYVDHDFAGAVERLETAVSLVEAAPQLEIDAEGLAMLYFYLGKAKNVRGQFLGEKGGQAMLQRAWSFAEAEPALPLALAAGYNSLGDEEQRDARLDDALRLTHAWLDDHPEDTAALYNRSIIYQIQGEPALAAASLQRVIEIDPEMYAAYISLGLLEAERGQFPAALSHLQEALDLAEKSGADPAWAHINLGEVYRRSGRPEAADEAYRAAIAARPEFDLFHWSYARFLAAQGEQDAALLAYRKMAAVSDNPGWAYGELAAYQYQLKLWGAAAQNYQKAIAEQPENPLLHVGLAEVYVAEGRFEEAWAAFETAVSLDDGHYSPALYGYHLARQGRLERAAEMYELALQKRPSDRESLQNLGLIYQRLERPQAAIAIYQRLLEAATAHSDAAAAVEANVRDGPGVEFATVATWPQGTAVRFLKGK